MAGILIGWIVFSCIAGAIASNKGNSFAGAFFISILLSPIIGIVIALVQKPNEAVVEKRQLQTGALRKCPFCAELIKKEAHVCHYCGRELPPPDPTTVTAALDEESKAIIRWVLVIGALVAVVLVVSILLSNSRNVSYPRKATVRQTVYFDDGSAPIPAGT
jgi:hypothetical protein